MFSNSLKHCVQSVFIYLETQSFLETHFVDISHIFLETVLAFETIANWGASHSLGELLLQPLFSQLQQALGLQLVAELQEGNYKKAWELDNGSRQETEQTTEDWEDAKGRHWNMAGRETDIVGLLDQQVEVLTELCQPQVWLWQLVLQL